MHAYIYTFIHAYIGKNRVQTLQGVIHQHREGSWGKRMEISANARPSSET